MFWALLSKIKSARDNPAHDCIFNLECLTLYENTNIRPLGFYMKAFIKGLEEDQDLDYNPKFLSPTVSTSGISSTGCRSLPHQ